MPKTKTPKRRKSRKGGRARMTMERSLARQIACDALNPHIDTVLKPTEKDEGHQIGATLKNIEKQNSEEINDIVRVIVKKCDQNGYDTTIDPPAVLRCDTVGDLVDEIQGGSSSK
jgi:predicted Zn-ribbon and HTH transcriptional regulator